MTFTYVRKLYAFLLLLGFFCLSAGDGLEQAPPQSAPIWFLSFLFVLWILSWLASIVTIFTSDTEPWPVPLVGLISYMAIVMIWFSGTPHITAVSPGPIIEALYLFYAIPFFQFMAFTGHLIYDEPKQVKIQPEP